MGGSTSRRCVLGALAMAFGGLVLHPLPASAETGSATILHRSRGHACAGQDATLAWSPPEGVSELTGYRITQSITTPSTPQVVTTEVGADQTRLPFTVPFGLSNFQIRSITTTGVGEQPFTSASIMGNQVPQPMAWAGAGAGVGDGTALVPFKWYGPINWSTTGGLLPTTIRVTASTGVSTTSAAPHDGSGVATTFTGLANGVDHAFTAVTFNACGSSAASVSPTYVPGAQPVWSQASPPLTVARNAAYRYRFVASGAPAATYRLVGAPAWLTVGPDGQVSGNPPKGATSFSYSVTASNGVGIQPGIMVTDIVAGPFTVNVSKR